MRRAGLCVVVALLLPVLLAAQAVTGTILGVITDSTGAVMPGTTVTLTNTGTGLVRSSSQSVRCTSQGAVLRPRWHSAMIRPARQRTARRTMAS